MGINKKKLVLLSWSLASVSNRYNECYREHRLLCEHLTGYKLTLRDREEVSKEVTSL